jgi:hypothetical protein
VPGNISDHRPLCLNADDYLRCSAVPTRRNANFREYGGVISHKDGAPAARCAPALPKAYCPSCPVARTSGPTVGPWNTFVQEVQRLLLCLQVMMRVLRLQARRLAGINCLSSLINCTF